MRSRDRAARGKRSLTFPRRTAAPVSRAAYPRGMRDERDGWSIASLAIATVMGVLVGGFVGALTTFTHRQWRLPLGSFHPPLGLVVGLVLLAVTLAGLRLAFVRVVAAGGAIGAVVVIALLALPGAGGSALVTGDAIGWAWIAGAAVVGAAVSAWPAGTARRTGDAVVDE